MKLPASLSAFVPKLFPRSQVVTSFEIIVEADGFRVSENGILGEIWLWTSQEEIVASKDSSGPNGHIELAFIVPGDDDYYYLNDEVPGFDKLIAAMESNLPGLDVHWQDKIAEFGSGTSGMLIYEKQEKTP